MRTQLIIFGAFEIRHGEKAAFMNAGLFSSMVDANFHTEHTTLMHNAEMPDLSVTQIALD